MSQLSTKQLGATVGGVGVLIAVVYVIASTSKRFLNKPDNSNNQIQLTGTNKPLASNLNAPLGSTGPQPPVVNPLQDPQPPVVNQLQDQQPPVVNPLQDQQPPVANPLPPVVNPLQPPVANPLPPVVNPLPPVANPLPPVGNPLPPVGNPLPPVGNPLPPVGNPMATSLPDVQDGPSNPNEPMTIQGEIIQLSSGETIGRALFPDQYSYNTGDIARITILGQFHSNLSMPRFRGEQYIYFDPTPRSESDPPNNDLPSPYQDEEETKDDSKTRNAALLRADGIDIFSDITDSQESRGNTSFGGKKTKTTKKSKKKTRKHRRILNQVKKLLKEI